MSKRSIIAGPSNPASTEADGANVTLGAIADAGVSGAGTVSGKLRFIATIFNDIWDIVNHCLKVKLVGASAVTSAQGAPNDGLSNPAGLQAWPVVLSDNFSVNPLGKGSNPLNVQFAAVPAINVSQVGGVAVVAGAKGAQQANAIPTQEMKDAGRTPVILVLDNIAGIVAEALATMTINKGGVVTSVTQYTVTAGKTLRITSFTYEIVNPAAANASGRARIRSANPVAAGSPIFAALAAGTSAAVANVGYEASVSFPDGIEIAAGQQVGITHIESSAIASGVSACVTGFEY
jgi:hypothetical protein